MLKKKPNGNLVSKAVRQYQGRDVSLDVDQVEHDTLQVVLCTATCGATTLELSHNFGPNDGSFGPMPEDHVQKSIDGLMAQAARAAAHRESVREQLANYAQTSVAR